MSTDADTIWVHSHVSASSGEGYVVLSWGTNQAQMTPDEAISHALGIIEAAHAAETDAALGKALGGFDETTARLLLLLRKYRTGGSRFHSFKAGYHAPRAEEER